MSNEVQQLEELVKEAEELGIKVTGKSTVNSLKKAIEKATHVPDKDATEGAEQISESAPTDSVEFWESEDGQLYGFKDNMASSLNWGGNSYTQKELLQNDKIMTQLVGGNYAFVKRIK